MTAVSFYVQIVKEAKSIGRETLEMWNQVFARAKEEVERHKK